MRPLLRLFSAALISLLLVSGGWLGILVQDLTPQSALQHGLLVRGGVLVTRVQFNSPAMKGGLEEGDVIIALNDRKVSDSKALQKMIGRIEPGTEIRLTIVRRRKEKSLQVVLGAPPRSAA